MFCSYLQSFELLSYFAPWVDFSVTHSSRVLCEFTASGCLEFDLDLSFVSLCG